MAFNPNEHLMQVSNKDYLEVKWRMVWFRDLFPHGTIETEMIHLDLDRETEEEVTKWVDRKPIKSIHKANGFVIFRATVKNGQGGIGVGTKSEKAASFPDYIEKCESGAIGRALAALGFGTQFTGDELAEHHRIVDSPVDQIPSRQNGQDVLIAAPTNGQKTPLQRAVGAAMQRALTAKLIANEAEFSGLLDKIGVSKPATGQDINKINTAISEMIAAAK